MTLHADALAVLRAWQPPSAEQGRLRDRYVGHLEARPDGMQRDCLPAHVTCSVLVFDAAYRRLLLTLHRKSGRWFQLGGHTEAGDATLAAAALREAVEESGMTAAELRLAPVPALLDAHAVPFCGPGGDTWHLDVMFSAVAHDDARITVSEESVDVRWWPLDDLPDPELADFVALALADRPGQSTSSSGGISSLAAADQPSR